MTDDSTYNDDKTHTIAIVGMSGKFPGAQGVREFWKNLLSATDGVEYPTISDLRARGVDEKRLANPNLIRSAGRLANADLFDAEFFGISPREAALIDPQHRLLLEMAYHALEDAGCAPSRFGGAIGTFVGVGAPVYLAANLLSNRDLVDSVGIDALMLANDKSYAATRLAYKLDLRGPSVVVDTACSSSLVAVHYACNSLLMFESDVALAGGCRVIPAQEMGEIYQEGGILARDGVCRTFDARASGTIFGSGGGLVVLKRLEDAINDRDHIYAIIRGTAVNNDGAEKMSFSAPSARGQRDVILSALEVAGVKARTIGYVEAHGTGTLLGDPIEVGALTAAFRETTSDSGFCTLGAVKTSIGHLDVAAGIAGLIKAALAVQSGKIPGNLHFEEANPHIDFAQTPFIPCGANRDWPEPKALRRAGVSSLGIGGTNAHVILEAPPRRAQGSQANRARLLIISAASARALDDSCAILADRIQAEPDLRLSDIEYTLQVGRERHRYMASIVCRNREEAIAALLTPNSGHRIESGRLQPRGICWTFAGQGGQFPGMAHGLYEDLTTFRATLDRLLAQIDDASSHEIKQVLGLANDSASVVAADIHDTRLSQPCLFLLGLGLAEQWKAWGIRPDALLGHSLGEIVAACVAGILEPEDAFRVVVERSRAISALPSGTADAVDSARDRLAAEGTPIEELAKSHAFHSSMLDGAEDRVRNAFAGVKLKAPIVPILSNLTGTWMTADQACDPEYWVRQLRNAVQVRDCFHELHEHTIFDFGSGSLMSGLAVTNGIPQAQVFNCAMSAENDQAEVVLSAVASLVSLGVEPNWNTFHQDDAVRVSLPSYPFESKKHWIEPVDWVGQANPKTTGDRMHVTLPPKQNDGDHLGPTESGVLNLWRELLGIEELDRDADFVDAGGDSLLSIRFATRMRDDHGIELSTEHLLKYRTSRELADYILADGEEGEF